MMKAADFVPNRNLPRGFDSNSMSTLPVRTSIESLRVRELPEVRPRPMRPIALKKKIMLNPQSLALLKQLKKIRSVCRRALRLLLLLLLLLLFW